METAKLVKKPEFKWTDFLACPMDGSSLIESPNQLHCTEKNHSFAIVDGTPVLYNTQIPKGLWGINIDSNLKNDSIVDPFVQQVIGATGGYFYIPLEKGLRAYPIPQISLPEGNQKILLDIGCNWGRWTLAAAKKGYIAIGMDPHLEAVQAAKRVAAQLSIEAHFVVGDARCMPFKKETFDLIYSYSVLQHFSEEALLDTIISAKKILKPSGEIKIQMANKWGLRSFQHQLKRRFRKPKDFEVRYWTPQQLISIFKKYFQNISLEADGFFSVNPQMSDLSLLPWRFRIVLLTSQLLKKMTHAAKPLIFFADSLFVKASTPK